MKETSIMIKGKAMANTFGKTEGSMMENGKMESSMEEESIGKMVKRKSESGTWELE